MISLPVLVFECGGLSRSTQSTGSLTQALVECKPISDRQRINSIKGLSPKGQGTSEYQRRSFSEECRAYLFASPISSSVDNCPPWCLGVGVPAVPMLDCISSPFFPRRATPTGTCSNATWSVMVHRAGSKPPWAKTAKLVVRASQFPIPVVVRLRYSLHQTKDVTPTTETTARL